MPKPKSKSFLDEHAILKVLQSAYKTHHNTVFTTTLLREFNDILSATDFGNCVLWHIGPWDPHLCVSNEGFISTSAPPSSGDHKA